MTKLIIWKDQEIGRLRKDMDRTFRRFCDDFGISFSNLDKIETFPMELLETEEAVIVTAEIPGMDPKQLDISIKENQLLIRGKREESVEKAGKFYHRTKQRSETFSRSISLPCRVKISEVESTYKDNLLKIIMPKMEPKKTERTYIDVK
jgi:HSP20 family protein